jgi:hypothetical protein
MASLPAIFVHDGQWLTSLILGSLFVFSGLAKLVYRSRFRDTVAAMEMLPPWLTAGVSWALPPLEIAPGLALLAGWQVRVAGAVTLGLLLLFVLVLGGYRLRGGKELVCGCFADFKNKVRTSHLLVRNVLLLVLGLFLISPGDLGAPWPGALERLAAGLAVLGTFLSWHLTSRLVETVSLLRAESAAASR